MCEWEGGVGGMCERVVLGGVVPHTLINLKHGPASKTITNPELKVIA